MSNDMVITAPLEDFIASFNRYEDEMGFFLVRDQQDFPWWDLVRYRVQFALCVERGIFGRSSVAPPSKLIRAKSFARQALILLRDIARIRESNTMLCRELVVSRRSLAYLDGVAATGAASGFGALFVSQTGDAPVPHVAITSQSIQFFTRLAKLPHRVPPEIEQVAKSMADDICVRFQSKVDIFGVIAAKYREELAARRAWSFILDKAGAVERLIYVNDDTLKSLVKLARARGIETEEVQHAYMGSAHIGFSYPPLDGGLATLPDRVIVTRDTGDIIYPVKRIVVKAAVKRRAMTSRDIDVLIGSSPMWRKETSDIVAALVGQGLRLAVKLHPAENKKTSDILMLFSPDDVAVHDGNEEFCELASRARLFIPVNAGSTTAFEAEEMGARVILVDIGGRKKTAVSDGVASARVGSLQSLPGVVRSQLAAAEADPEHVAGDER